MKLAVVFQTGLALCLGTISGCAPWNVSDPPSDAPELAGRWEVTGAVLGAYGYMIADDTGDPVEIEDHPQLASIFGERTVHIDGQRHSTRSGLEYLATGSATVNDGAVAVALQLEVTLGGIRFGESNIRIVGEFVETDRIEAMMYITQDLPNYVDRYSEPGTAVRVGT